MKCDFFENFLSLAMTIHAAGDKWADRSGSVGPTFTGSPGGGTLPSFLMFKIFILLSRPFA